MHVVVCMLLRLSLTWFRSWWLVSSSQAAMPNDVHLRKKTPHLRCWGWSVLVLWCCAECQGNLFFSEHWVTGCSQVHITAKGLLSGCQDGPTGLTLKQSLPFFIVSFFTFAKLWQDGSVIKGPTWCKWELMVITTTLDLMVLSSEGLWIDTASMLRGMKTHLPVAHKRMCPQMLLRADSGGQTRALARLGTFATRLCTVPWIWKFGIVPCMIFRCRWKVWMYFRGWNSKPLESQLLFLDLLNSSSRWFVSQVLAGIRRTHRPASSRCSWLGDSHRRSFPCHMRHWLSIGDDIRSSQCDR